MKKIASVRIYKGRDFTTPPKTKVKMVRDSFGIKWPVVKKKYMNTVVELVIKGPDEKRIKDQVKKCLGKSAVRGLVTGIITGYATGGAGAVEAGVITFGSTLDACVENAVDEEVEITAKLNSTHKWDSKWR